MGLSQQNKNKGSKLLKFLGVFLYVFTIAVLFVGITYFVWSIVLIIYSLIEPSDSQTIAQLVVQAILNFLSLFVEVMSIFYTVMLFKHMSTTCSIPLANEEETLDSVKDFSMVSVLVPIHYPNLDVLNDTLQSIRDSNYSQDKIQILIGDDTEKSPEYDKKISHLSEKHGAIYVYDETNYNFKAGMLNIMLKQVKADYVVFLDYDHRLTPNFLRKSISKLVEDENIAFVQAKVNFRNIKSKLQIWEAVMYAQFFEVFERSKNKRKKVIFNGSTACFRKKVLDEVGGIPIATFTEDVDLTIQILTRGYDSVLIDEYGSFGLVPSNFPLLLSQILRWAKGSMHTLKLRWKTILKGQMSLFDRIDLSFSTLLFFIASSMYLTIFLYVIMFFTGSKAIRLPTENFPPLILMPIALAISYQISAIIAVLFSKKGREIKINAFDLLVFFLIALTLNPFTVYAVMKTIFRRREPDRRRDQWNEKVPFIPVSAIISLLGVGLLVLSYFDFIGSSQSLWVVMGLLGLSLIATFPVSLFFYITTRHNKPYFTPRKKNDIEV
ncbi:MAG: glycosyltransferase [Candidatus Heimdallarchaeota archaeon]|nr:glycosyltransferase [Candidatus Heimdallarchaeota archaeon]